MSAVEPSSPSSSISTSPSPAAVPAPLPRCVLRRSMCWADCGMLSDDTARCDGRRSDESPRDPHRDVRRRWVPARTVGDAGVQATASADTGPLAAAPSLPPSAACTTCSRFSCICFCVSESSARLRSRRHTYTRHATKVASATRPTTMAPSALLVSDAVPAGQLVKMLHSSGSKLPAWQ